MSIHPTAIIDPGAIVEEDVVVGPYSIIGAGVHLHRKVRVESHVMLKGPTEIGEEAHIYSHAVVGEDTSAFAYQGEASTLSIGARTVIREFTSIHRGMAGRGVMATVIGSDCLLMPYTHVAHDCVIGDFVVIANSVQLAGHVVIGDYVNIGGQVGIAQFRNVGVGVHIAANSFVIKDVAAWSTVIGNPAKMRGLNLEGMRRRNFSSETMSAIKSAYQTVFRRGHTTEEALEQLVDLAQKYHEIDVFVESIKNSHYGVTR